ncbi:hypothetical protein PMARG_ME00162 [Candidatus Mikella endobia]|uniref:Uncharacterized protein n=1 Tax=Candidatus Mikella endobia TaxID=1778264 RepID=A0A143WQ57_9ENTR|nr:hypothetical protein PMARG_ME00162 [Candidatus Mikella endobia]
MINKLIIISLNTQLFSYIITLLPNISYELVSITNNVIGFIFFYLLISSSKFLLSNYFLSSKCLAIPDNLTSKIKNYH